MSVYPSSYARMPILSQQNTCNSFFMRILSLYRRVFFFLLLFSMLGSYYNFMLVCFFFTFGVCFIYVLCARFFSSFCQKCLFFFLSLFFYETAFISRFRYRFPRNISHFPNYSVYIYTHDYMHVYIHQK